MNLVLSRLTKQSKAIMDRDQKLYREFKSHLVLRGETISGWCANNNISRQWVYKALTKENECKAAKEVVSKISSELEVEC